MRIRLPFLILYITISSCMGPKEHYRNYTGEVIGHRGHVSRYPQNTLDGFISLLNTGADAIEMDLVISKDKKVVVSHEPYMAAAYMLTPEGRRIKRSEQKDYLLYQMTYDSIKRYISGSIKNPKFPRQKKVPAYKPLLEEVFAKVEQKILEQRYDHVTYYLELKSEPDQYGVSQPFPEEFAHLVMEVVYKKGLQERVVLKSFDAQLLNIIHENYPKAQISYLLYRTSIEEGLPRLAFKPDIISPHFKQLRNPEKVSNLQDQGFKIIPWTVNNLRHIKRMMNMNVDGIITDHPERVIAEKVRRNNQ